MLESLVESCPDTMRIWQSSQRSVSAYDVVDVTVRLVSSKSTAQPQWLRVAASTGTPTELQAGRQLIGPLSDQAPALFAKCQSASGPSEEYLATHFVQDVRWDDVRCSPCPAGARCRGLPWEAMTNQAGWQRTEWDPLGLTFIRCPRADACPVQPASRGITTAGGMLDQTLMPSSHIDPSGEWRAHFHGTESGGARTQVCQSGRTGHLCQRCEPGWTRSPGNVCSTCASPAVQWLSLFGGLLLGAILLGYMIRTTLKGTAEAVNQGTAIKSYVALNKLLFTHLQQIAIAASFPMNWPPFLLRMFAVFDSSASVSQDLVSVDCMQWHSSAFVAGTATQLLLPLFIIAVLAIIWSTVAAIRLQPCACLSARCGTAASSKPHRSEIQSTAIATRDEVIPSVVLPGTDSLMQHNPLNRQGAANLSPPQMGRSRSLSHAKTTSAMRLAARRRSMVAAAGLGHGRRASGTPASTGLIVSALVGSFLLHLSLTKTSLGTLTCVQLAPGKYYLLGDFNISCSSEEWTPLAAIGMCGLLLYGVGIPFSSWALLWKHRDDLRIARIKARYGFLYMQYKPRAWYWESVTLMRKVGLAVIAVLLATQGTGVQVMCSIALLVGSLVVHLIALPHVDERLNMLEAGSLAVAVATLAGGAVLVDAEAPAAWTAATSVVIVLLNTLFIAAAVGALVYFLYTDKGLRKRAMTSMKALKKRATSTHLPGRTSNTGAPSGPASVQNASAALCAEVRGGNGERTESP